MLPPSQCRLPAALLHVQPTNHGQHPRPPPLGSAPRLCLRAAWGSQSVSVHSTVPSPLPAPLQGSNKGRSLAGSHMTRMAIILLSLHSRPSPFPGIPSFGNKPIHKVGPLSGHAQCSLAPGSCTSSAWKSKLLIPGVSLSLCQSREKVQELGPVQLWLRVCCAS